MSKILVAALALVAAMIPAAAAPIPPTEVIPLVPDSTFKVEIDGAEIPTAETYMVGSSSLLILGCSLKDPILLATSDRTVRYFPEVSVMRDGEGNVSLRGSPSDPICTYQYSAGQIVFQAEGRKVRLSPKPPLVGPQTLEAIIRHHRDYETRIKGYKPDSAAVAYLSKYARKTDVQVYFGSWCSVCEAWIPRLVKALQSAQNLSIETQFIALPRNFSTDPSVRSKGIQGVPTILVLQDGREVGRLHGRPDTGSIEAALVRILQTTGG
jgi:thiol-disulfide isomerase/thioredoxin